MGPARKLDLKQRAGSKKHQWAARVRPVNVAQSRQGPFNQSGHSLPTNRVAWGANLIPTFQIVMFLGSTQAIDAIKLCLCFSFLGPALFFNRLVTIFVFPDL